MKVSDDVLAELRSMSSRLCDPRPRGEHDMDLYVGYVLIDGSGYVEEITDDGVVFGLLDFKHMDRVIELCDQQLSPVWEEAYPILACRLRPENSFKPAETAKILAAARAGAVGFDRWRGHDHPHDYVYYNRGKDPTLADIVDRGVRYCCTCGRAESSPPEMVGA